VNGRVFSIVIPTFNRPEHLARCVDAVRALNYPPNQFEVIVVDDGSPESDEAGLQQFRRQLSLSYYRIEHGGPAAARNYGAEQATGNFLAFVDDDCSPLPSWLSAMEGYLEQDTSVLVAGRAINAIQRNAYSDASQVLIDYLMGYFNSDPEQACFVTSNNMGVNREKFLDAGGFDVRFRGAGGEDREFGDRWRQLGLRVAYHEDVRVMHFHQLTFARFCRQHFNYGRGAAMYHHLRSGRAGGQVRIEPFRFYWDLILHPFSDPAQERPARTSTLMVVSQLANATGFFYENLAPANLKNGTSDARATETVSSDLK
jgi:glycosyltransferase involved in cell wall biosynthesis